MLPLGKDDRALLEQICDAHGVSKDLVLELLQTEDDLAGMGRRHGLYDRIADVLEQFSKESGARQ